MSLSDDRLASDHAQAVTWIRRIVIGATAGKNEVRLLARLGRALIATWNLQPLQQPEEMVLQTPTPPTPAPLREARHESHEGVEARIAIQEQLRQHHVALASPR